MLLVRQERIRRVLVCLRKGRPRDIKRHTTQELRHHYEWPPSWVSMLKGSLKIILEFNKVNCLPHVMMNHIDSPSSET